MLNIPYTRNFVTSVINGVDIVNGYSVKSLNEAEKKHLIESLTASLNYFIEDEISDIMFSNFHGAEVGNCFHCNKQITAKDAFDCPGCFEDFCHSCLIDKNGTYYCPECGTKIE